MGLMVRPDAGLVGELWSDFEKAHLAVEAARKRFLETREPRHWEDYLEADRIANEARHRAEVAHHAHYSS